MERSGNLFNEEVVIVVAVDEDAVEVAKKIIIKLVQNQSRNVYLIFEIFVSS